MSAPADRMFDRCITRRRTKARTIEGLRRSTSLRGNRRKGQWIDRSTGEVTGTQSHGEDSIELFCSCHGPPWIKFLVRLVEAKLGWRFSGARDVDGSTVDRLRILEDSKAAVITVAKVGLIQDLQQGGRSE